MSNIIFPNGEPGKIITSLDNALPEPIICSENGPSNAEMASMGFKNPKQVNELKYIIKDILSGDPAAAKDERYSYLNFKQVKIALDWLQNNNFDEELQTLLMSEPWRLVYKTKPPTPEEFLSNKYIGAMADNLFLPVKKNFLDFFDVTKPYRNAYLNPSIGAGKPLPYSNKITLCIRFIDIVDDDGAVYHIPENDKLKVIINGKKRTIRAKELEKIKDCNWGGKIQLIKYMKKYIVNDIEQLCFNGNTYDDLITFFKKVDKSLYEKYNIYVQKHHIIPRSEGGTDEESNLIELPYKYHMMAHYLRGKEATDKLTMYKNFKAVLYALNEKSIPKTIKEFSSKIDFVVESLEKNKSLEKEHIWATDGKKTIRIFEDELKDYPGFRRGRTFKSPSSKKWMNKDGKNYYFEKSEVEQKLKEGYELGMFKTENMIKYNHPQSRSTLDTKWMNKNGINKAVKVEEIETYKGNGWVLGHVFKNALNAPGRRMVDPSGKVHYVRKSRFELRLSQGWKFGESL